VELEGEVAAIQNVPTHVQINVSALAETLRHSSRLKGHAEEVPSVQQK